MIKSQIIKNETVQPNTRELEKLKEILPQYFDKEGNFKLDSFKELLKLNEINVEKEGYELKFLGKNYSKFQSGLETETVIVPDIEHNSKEENINSENMYIVGDNLDALKHLLKSYSNKIKCIYIDPPYNTNSNDFIYNDNFFFTPEILAEKMGIDEEEANKIIDLKGKSSHSAWLTFMYSRLELARDLLTDDGVIFISIDDNEQANLKLICDDIFGEENFISTISVENNPKGRKNSSHISISSEYLFIYAKNKKCSFFLEVIPKNASDMSKDENGNYVHNSGKRILVGENDFNPLIINETSEKNYSVYYNKTTNQIYLKTEKFEENDDTLINKGYKKYYSYNKNNLTENTYTKTKFLELFSSGALDIKENKIYEKNFNDTIRMKSQLSNRKYEAIVAGKKQEFSLNLTTTGANSLLKTMFGINDNLFENPKSVDYIKILIKMLSEKDFYTLDFFSGSATTAHAVMELNKEDNGNRKYIMVQLPEKIKEENPNVDCGFKLFRLREVEKNMIDKIIEFDPKVTPLFMDNYVEAFKYENTPGKDTILTTWLNEDGYGLIAKSKKIKLIKCEIDVCNNSAYIIEQGIISEDIMKLIEMIEENILEVNRIVIYPYSIPFNIIHELKNNIKQLHTDVELIERY